MLTESHGITPAFRFGVAGLEQVQVFEGVTFGVFPVYNVHHKQPLSSEAAVAAADNTLSLPNMCRSQSWSDILLWCST